MIYSFSLISFIFIAHHFLISNASPSEDDKILIAFMKGHQEMQISEYSIQKYESHLGIVYYIRKKWQCAKIADEFEEYERTECQKYRKYLDILYEYLCREYAEIPSVKPKFVFKKEIEINGPIIYAVNCLAKISQFYFKSHWSLCYKYKLDKLFIFHFEMLNVKRLNYELKLKNEPKLPINEMILQLAIDTENEWQTNESLDGIIRQNFDKKLKEMFKKHCKYDEIKVDNMQLIISKFDNMMTWTEDALFSEFAKGLATNFEKFFKTAKKYSNYLYQKKEKGNIDEDDLDEQMIPFGLYEIEKMKKHLMQKYEAHFGIMYLMRMNWQCDKIGKKFNEYKRNICLKLQIHLEILYEYLFRLYIEGKSNELARKLAAVKPIFMPYYGTNQRNLISVVKTLNEFSKCFWAKNGNIFWDFKWNELNLKNEVELNYEIKEEENLLKKINGPKNVQKKENKILNLSNEIEDNLRQEFEQKMEEIYENTKKNAKEEKAKLDKAIENAAYEEKKHLRNVYNDKFGIFISSPFSNFFLALCKSFPISYIFLAFL